MILDQSEFTRHLVLLSHFHIQTGGLKSQTSKDTRETNIVLDGLAVVTAVCVFYCIILEVPVSH